VVSVCGIPAVMGTTTVSIIIGLNVMQMHKNLDDLINVTHRCVTDYIIIIIINEIYRAQNSQGQQMRQVSCCMIQLS